MRLRFLVSDKLLVYSPVLISTLPQLAPYLKQEPLGLILTTAVPCFHRRLLARSQYSEGPATGHLDTGFSCFPCVYKLMLKWFPRFQVATTCFSCSPPDLNLLVTNFIFCMHVK